MINENIDFPAGKPLSTRGALVRLGAVVGLIVAAMLLLHLGALLVIIVSLIVVVALHELGHFVTAKISHMKVTEAFLGFGPRLWSIRRGETDYGIKPLLFGAYVKIPGMTNLEVVDPATEPRTYRQAPFRNRLLVASAGSITHFILAFILAWVAIVSFGVASKSAVVVEGFVQWQGHSQTAAHSAGMKSGDIIERVNGKVVASPTTLAKAIQKSHGATLKLTLTRNHREKIVYVTPVLGHRGATDTEVVGGTTATNSSWLVGVESAQETVRTGEGPIRALGTAGNDLGRVVTATGSGLGHVFSLSGLSNLLHQATSAKAATSAANHPATSSRVLSIVGAARVATQAEQAGFLYFLEVLIALNVAFGLLNMVPMLPLDGGHVAIAIYERIRTRRGASPYHADAAKLLPVAYVFMAALVVFVGLALFLDIAHPAANPFR